MPLHTICLVPATSPLPRFEWAKELCLALQQTLHHLRFTCFHRQRHLRGREKGGQFLYSIATHCKHFDLPMAAYYCWHRILQLRSPSTVLHNCLQSISLTFCCCKVQRGLPVIVWQVNHGLGFLLVCFVFPCFDHLIDCEYHKTKDVRSRQLVSTFKISILCPWHEESKATQTVPQDSLSLMHHSTTRANTNALTSNQSNYGKVLRSRPTLCCKAAPSQCCGLDEAWKQLATNQLSIHFVAAKNRPMNVRDAALLHST